MAPPTSKDEPLAGVAAELPQEDVKEEDEEHSESKTNQASKKRAATDMNARLPPLGTAITQEGERPQKKFYRQRAHCNPLSHNDSFTYKARPDLMDWTEEHYPELSSSDHQTTICPTVLDIGCGFGGLTMALATLLPHEIILGMEIRAKVTEYVRLRILAARKEHPGQYQNASVLRTNSMKFLPHLFAKASIHKLFFCFPDPHFKRKNHPRRIISERLLAEYAFVLQPTVGRLYCITDVKELHDWHVEKCDAHPLFRRLSDDELENDPCVQAMRTETEESKKVDRAGGEKYHAVYQRIPDDEALQTVAQSSFFAKE